MTTLPVMGEEQAVKPIQVAGITRPNQLAGSIAEEVRQALQPGEDGKTRPLSISLHAIGPQAVNQAVKSVPIANSYLASMGIVLTILPSFSDQMVDNGEGTGTSSKKTIMQLRIIAWRIGG